MECLNREMITFVGIGALAHAVIKGCPKLQEIYLTNSEFDEEFSAIVNEIIEGMLRGAGRDGDVRVLENYWE
jgi:hypothetical protein